VPRKGWYGSKWCWPATRWAIYFRDHMECVWCGKKDGAETLDHLIPGDRGSKRPHHLVASCLTCNSKRKRMPAGRFLALCPDPQATRARLDRRFDQLDRKNALARKALYVEPNELEWSFGACSDEGIPF
jgi:5-methylcytosine-specific restriction endonuclease McrA